ncbi:MAG TPA: hypothetical protein VEI07_12995 [Planctomycetaceae bacterium]|nr:hypothetical protein [Planctomycetaceae bacterium]
MPRTTTSGIIVCLGALALCGCSRGVPLGQVDGIVRVDGAPMADAMVTFIPEDRKLPQSTGFTDSDGHFHLRCNNGAMGAAVGEHRVIVIDAARAPSGKGKDDDDLPEGKDAPPSRVPLRYARPDKTPLRQAVEKGPQEVAIEIDSGRKAS